MVMLTRAGCCVFAVPHPSLHTRENRHKGLLTAQPKAGYRRDRPSRERNQNFPCFFGPGSFEQLLSSSRCIKAVWPGPVFSHRVIFYWGIEINFFVPRRFFGGIGNNIYFLKKI